MKKVLLVIAAIVAGFILLGSIGPLIGLVICLGVVYFSYKQYMKSVETASKVLWAIIGIIFALGAIGNLPAIGGVLAIIALYLIYKHWDRKSPKRHDDPFTNFEREWEKLNKNL